MPPLRRVYGHLTEEDLISRLLAEERQFPGLSENTNAVLRRLGYDPAIVRQNLLGPRVQQTPAVPSTGAAILDDEPVSAEGDRNAAMTRQLGGPITDVTRSLMGSGPPSSGNLPELSGVGGSPLSAGPAPSAARAAKTGAAGDGAGAAGSWGPALMRLLYGLTQLQQNQTAAGAAQMFNQWLTQRREQELAQSLGGLLSQVQRAIGSGNYDQAQALLNRAMENARDRATLKYLSDRSAQVTALAQSAQMRQAIAPLLKDNPLAAAIMAQPGATIKDVMPLLLDRYTFKTDPGTNAVLAIDKQSGAVTPLTQGMVKMRPDELLIRMGPEGPQVAVQVPGRRTVANLGSAFNLYALEKFKTTDLSSVPQDQLAQAAAEFRQMQERKEGPNLTGLMGVLAAKHGFSTKLSELKPEEAARVEQQWVNVQKFLAEVRGRATGAAELEKMMTAPLNFVNRDLVVLDTRTFSPDFKASFTDATGKPGKTIVREMDLRIINRINSMLSIVGDLKRVASRELALRPGENAYRALRIAIGRRLGDAGVAEFDALRSNLLGVAGLVQGDTRVSNLDYERVRGFNPQDLDTAESAVARLETLERSLSRMRAALSNLPVEGQNALTAPQSQPQQPVRKHRVNVPGIGEIEVEVK